MQLEQLITAHPQGSTPEAQKVLKPQKFDEKAYDRERKAKQRASGKELYIPVPKNIELRNRCLSDPELLLTTYFLGTYTEPFTADRRDMLSSIWRASLYGGDQSIAGSRGEGKTTLAMDGAFCLMISMLCSFPVVIGKNQDSASDELIALRERMASSERFIEDFPELGIPLEAVGASTANARLQTVGGKYIRMHLGAKFFAFPLIDDVQLPHWREHRERYGVNSVARGQIMGAVGIEGKIRGCKFRVQRPKLALIDDVEDKDSARSDEQIAKIETIIEEDIAGMGASAERIARVYLCTTLNRKCNAYKYTDKKQKPNWNGRRYRKMIKPPDRMDLVETYIELRKGHAEDDPDSREAFKFWRDNQEVIEAGSIVSNPYSHSKKIHADGEPLELSAVQSYYNRVADFGQKAVSTEIDNDPPEETGPVGVGITAEIVASRLSGLAKRQLPANCTALTAAIDLGKHYCHWAVVGWWAGAGGVVVDYGVAEVLANRNVKLDDKAADMAASEPAIYTALLNWRDELLNKNYADTTGTIRKVDFVFVDSGNFTRAAYEFCRQVKGVFHPSKGMEPFRPKTKEADGIIPGSNIYAARQTAENVWLYHLDTSHWKGWVHERFLTPTFDENNMLRRGAISLFDADGRAHHAYAQHIVAEQYVTEFKEGKGSRSYWDVQNDNNHWLDATYMAAAASEAVGIKLIGPVIEHHPVAKVDKPKVRSTQHGSERFRKRAGGWIPKRGNR
jgi:hypothetical protein